MKTFVLCKFSPKRNFFDGDVVVEGGLVGDRTENKPQKKKTANRRRAERTKTQSRLLSLLTILVAERCSITQKTIKSKIGFSESDQFWKNFITGDVNLPDHTAKKLADYLRQKIQHTIGEERHHPLARDLCYLRTRVLNELDADYLELTGSDDQYQVDRELLYALDIDRDRQVAKPVQDRVHGFWFVLRYSTTADKTGPCKYCVSLLSVNSNAYMRLMGENEKPVPVMTSIPHFTLRSGHFLTEGGSEERIYRGQIIQSFEPKPVLNFIGVRDSESPPLFLMTLKMNGAKQHASEGYGVILSSNPSTVIAGPVGACNIPLSDAIVEATARLSKDAYEIDIGISKLYREQRASLEKLVRSYSESELIDHLGPLCTGNALQNVIRRLAKARDEARNGECAGYYFIPTA